MHRCFGRAFGSQHAATQIAYREDAHGVVFHQYGADAMFVHGAGGFGYTVVGRDENRRALDERLYRCGEVGQFSGRSRLDAHCVAQAFTQTTQKIVGKSRRALQKVAKNLFGNLIDNALFVGDDVEQWGVLRQQRGKPEQVAFFEQKNRSPVAFQAHTAAEYDVEKVAGFAPCFEDGGFA